MPYIEAFIASITISVAKLTFQYTEPLVSAFYITCFIAIILTPYFIMQLKAVRDKSKHTLGLGVVSGLSIAFHYVGLSFIPAVYYISVKRMSMVFSVIFGRTFFHEKYFRNRILGASFMVIGVILIALG